MDSELDYHLEQLTSDLIRSGQSPAAAARNARIALGPALLHKEEMRASLGLRWWDELRANLRYGLRMLRKSPGFSFIAVSSLALAIGANTTIFSVGKQLLYARLSVPHPSELRLLRWDGDDKVAVNSMWGDFDPTADHGITSSVFSFPLYLQLREHNTSLRQLFAFKETSMNATVRDHAQRTNVAMVSGNYFAGLGALPQLGRTIQPTDDSTSGSAPVAMISDGLWQREFDRSTSALGQTITINQTLFTIIGVTPRGFSGAKSVQQGPEIYVPLTLQPVVSPKGKRGGLLTDPDLWWVNIMGRVRPGVPDTEARAELQTQVESVVRATMQLHAGESMPRMVLADGSRGLHVVDQLFKKPLYVLMAMAGFVLLLACANIANLLLARGAIRQREMSVRSALGAGRARLLRQLLTESLLLATLGGSGGLVLGYLGRNAIPRLMTNAWERGDLNTSFDWGVFAFTAAVTLLTGILFGLAPAWHGARADVGSSLKATSHTATRRRRGMGGKAIVAFQIALSTLLVVGAGLFLRTVVALNSIDVGFDPNNLLLFEIHPPASRYPAGKDVRLHTRIEQQFAAVPGVEAVAPGSNTYIANNLDNADFLPEGETFVQTQVQAEDVNIVGADFFRTMQLPILAGRAFGPQDTANSLKVGIINQSLAHKRFTGVNPIGKRFRADRDPNSDWIQVVGICADTRYVNLRELPPPQFFLPYAQQKEIGGMTYQIRTRLSPASITPALQLVLQSIDRDIPMVDIRTQRQQIDSTMQIERAFAAFTTGFGILALALACVGIYGIMAYSVAQRTNEIGIRLALGAQPGQVRKMILGESAWLAAVGVVAGAGAAFSLTRFIRSMLYGVEAYDPPTLAAGVALLLAVTMAATWIPSRRAAGVQPMEALRHE